jgi:K+-sensing histidine kinase KdpD
VDEVLEERKQRQQQSRETKHREAILAALAMFPDGETPRVIRETASISGTVANRLLAALIAEGIAEECSVKKNSSIGRSSRFHSAISAVLLSAMRSALTFSGESPRAMWTGTSVRPSFFAALTRDHHVTRSRPRA